MDAVSICIIEVEDIYALILITWIVIKRNQTISYNFSSIVNNPIDRLTMIMQHRNMSTLQIQSQPISLLKHLLTEIVSHQIVNISWIHLFTLDLLQDI